MTEYNPVLTELDHALANIAQWMAPKNVDKGILHTFSSAYVQPEPYGVVLVVSAWNYPLLLSLQPLIGAIAAGTYRIISNTNPRFLFFQSPWNGDHYWKLGH